jgi:glyoxylase-like metal-dependent hydrolase (beta-lactamase superfamily II)
MLKNAEFRSAEVLFDSEHRLDLGGVRVRLMALGPNHTRGDTAILVEEDGVLFCGEIAMNRAFAAPSTPQSRLKNWLAGLDRMEALKPAKVVPSHGEMGDASVISAYREYLLALEARVRELKGQNKSADEVAQATEAEFKAKYPNWTAPARVGTAAKAIYAQLP